MKRIETKLEQLTESGDVPLWRSHPSFFWVAAYLGFESFILGISMVLWGRQLFQSFAYDPVFQYLPVWLVGSLYLISATLTLIAIIFRKNILLRFAAVFGLVPTVMFTTGFVTLTVVGSLASITAVTRWTFAIIMYIRMLIEPFINPNSAR